MDKNILAKATTKAGTLLLECGAETYRVEDTMRRIFLQYGAKVVDSYATPSMIIISFSVNDEELIHNIKRTTIKGVDLTKIDKVNTLFRKICSEHIEINDFYSQLIEIEHVPIYPNWLKIFAAGMIGAGFGLFYKGSVKDIICSFFVGIILNVFIQKLDEIEFDNFLKM